MCYTIKVLLKFEFFSKTTRFQDKMALCNFVLLIFVFQVSQETVLTRCEVAKQLIERGFDKSKINDWVCLIESESSLNTKAINKHNTDGSWDYGPFQLNSRYWCQGQQTESNGCGVDCTDLLTDSLDPSAKCALKVFGVHGFHGWYGWIKKCENQTISSYTEGCKL